MAAYSLGPWNLTRSGTRSGTALFPAKAPSAVRIAVDFQTALDLIEMPPIHRLQPAELTRDDD